MSFTPEYLDYNLSPYTGLTRDSWLQAAKYLLTGIFDNISDMGSPLVMPRSEKKITYPHPDVPAGVREAERKAEIFEGLTRSFLAASVLIAEEPDLTINQISIKEYYRLHILRSCTEKESDEYVGSYADMQALTGSTDPYRPFQQTVETCTLVIGLWLCEDVLWKSFTKSEQDKIAAFLSGFAHANTVPQNWRLFNMLDLAFLHMNGYRIDESIMLDHAQNTLAWYAGDGWYRDGHSFDYYSCWAFQTYTPLWCQWYGYNNMPIIAERFEEYSNELMKTYPDFFDEDGHTNMWGRSALYRNAATCPFDTNLLFRRSTISYGLARRIASGSLLQFLERDDLLVNGIPGLGFYGPFSPLLQPYSCAESPFLMFKVFLCLHFKKNHPFWTMKEENGSWESLAPGQFKETVLNGPALAFTNHKSNGETILRTAKILKAPGDDHGMWNYAKLCYSSKYPWESAPATEDGIVIESQQYVLRSLIDDHTEKANAVFYGGHQNGVLYRRQFFNYNLETECHWLEAADLADFPLSLGIMRVDRFRIVKRPKEITLGAFGFPDNEGTEIRRRETNTAKAMILKGRDHNGRPKRLAMTIFSGFRELSLRHSYGTNPDSENSLIIYGKGSLVRQYDASEPCLFISQVITLNEDRDFTEDELFPIREIQYDGRKLSAPYYPGYASKVTIYMKDGTNKTIDYRGLEGKI
ncbi:MAG: DUF2264 domain-containing protein [Lachnospiraceae bacterium]|nr:DUF2264 domain-containing protein [Lachnospiraceae bacterium]